MYDVLREAGEAHGLVDFGYYSLESMRLEMGYRLWGSDISPQYSPLEAGLGRFVKLDKGEFLGRKALIAQKDQGLRFGLAGLIVDAADCDCHGDEPIYSGGHIVSSVESGGYGHTMQASLAYAYLPLDYLEAGTPLSVEILGEKRAATVTEQPPLLAASLPRSSEI